MARTPEEYYKYQNSLFTREWQISLKNLDLWKDFNSHTTEMIITKQGRCIFPHLELTITGLDPRAYYSIFVEFPLVSDHRYKYTSSGGWSKSGNAEVQNSRRRYHHLMSPQTGDYWMKQPISMKKLKLTNNSQAPEGQIVLTSMHMYQPVIRIDKLPDHNDQWLRSKTVEFPETQFVAVTAYQNREVTNLKISNNEFAKGFRENGKSKKRKSVEHEEDESSSVSSHSPQMSPTAAPQQHPGPLREVDPRQHDMYWSHEEYKRRKEAMDHFYQYVRSYHHQYEMWPRPDVFIGGPLYSTGGPLLPLELVPSALPPHLRYPVEPSAPQNPDVVQQNHTAHQSPEKNKAGPTPFLIKDILNLQNA